MRSSLALLTFAIILAFAACSDDAEEVPGSSVPGGFSDEFPPSGAQIVALSLVLPAEAHSGEVVTIKLAVDNPSDELVALRTGMPLVSFSLTGSDGTEAWSRAEGVASSLTAHTFAPGQRVEFVDVPVAERALVDRSGQPLQPGDYLLQGFFHDWDGWLQTEPATLTILP